MSSTTHTGKVWKCNKVERRLVECGILNLLRASNGTVRGTLRAAAVLLENDSGGGFPFDKRNIIERIFRNLEKRSAIRIVRSGSRFNSNIVTAIELVDETRFEVDGIVWSPSRTQARPPRVDEVDAGVQHGESAHGEAPVQRSPRRTPASSAAIAARCGIVRAYLRAAPERSILKKELRDVLEREHPVSFSTHDIVYHTLQDMQAEGVIRATPVNPRNFKLGQMITLVQDEGLCAMPPAASTSAPVTATAGVPAQAPAVSTPAASAPGVSVAAAPPTKRRRVKTPEELQGELAALDTAIAERIAEQQRLNAEIAAFREKQSHTRQAIQRYDEELGRLSPFLIREE